VTVDVTVDVTVRVTVRVIGVDTVRTARE